MKAESFRKARTGGRRGPRSAGLWERGQTLVVVALVLVALVAFLALIVDLGNVYAQRRLMQNAADAGALAGARALALGKDETTVRNAINQYTVVRNGAQAYQAHILTDTLTVTVTKRFNTYFASIVGVPTFDMLATARAGYSFPGSWNGGLMPMAVHKDAIPDEPGVTVEIWDDDKVSSDDNLHIVADGQRGWLNFNGGAVGDSELVDWVTNGYPGKVDVDDWINGTPGSKTSALHAMDVVRTGTTIFVPIYDSVRSGVMGSGSIDYHIVGFAAFYVKMVVDTGTPKFVQGRFERYVAAQEGGGTIDTGVRVIGLQG